MDNKNKKLLVSVVTVVLNGEKYIEQAILSVKNQDYPYIEHIVVDGGSTDKTLEIVKKYKETYNIKWSSEKDKGAVDAINKGFDIAQGDIFCSLDSDDVYLPHTIKKVAATFQSRPKADVVFGNSFLIDQYDRKIGYSVRTHFDFDMFLYLGMNITPQSAFWRREIHQKVNGMDRQYNICSDRDFFMRIALARGTFYHVRDFLSCYRLHQNQQTKNAELMNRENQKIFLVYAPKNISANRIKYRKIKVLIKKTIALVSQGDAWYVLWAIGERTNHGF
jgi:glycosyltransferase involved in cell wall biosynthesis